MAVTVRITFRDMEPLPVVERGIRRRIERMAHLSPSLTGARVVIDGPHRRRDGYHVRLELDADGDAVIVAHEPPRPELADAIADTFRAARQTLRDARDRRRAPGSGKVVALSRGHGFGYIASEDGRKLLFDGSSVKGGMDAVFMGAKVKFREEGGEAQLVLVA